MNPRLILLGSAIVCLIGIAWGGADGNSSAQSQPATEAIRSIGSDVQAERQAAASAVRADRVLIIRKLLAVVNARGAGAVVEKGSAFHIAVQLLGEMRALEAREFLLENAEKRINFPDGAKIPLEMHYPCAAALAKIGGGPETLTMIERGIVEARSVKKRRILTWVAYRMLDHELAAFWLEARATKVEKEAAKTLRMAAKEVVNGNKLLMMMIYGD